MADDPNTDWSLTTARLSIRRAQPCRPDVALLLELWTDPAVMTNVGFPSGLRTSAGAIERQLLNQGTSEFDTVLMVALRDTTELIGECKLGYPDSEGVAHTDIKLSPKHWSKGYGKEIKLALLGYLFERTICQQVRATPNRGNTASIALQQSVGGRRTGGGVHHFPEKMKAYTTDVPYFEYTVFREDWEKRLT